MYQVEGRIAGSVKAAARGRTLAWIGLLTLAAWAGCDITDEPAPAASRPDPAAASAEARAQIDFVQGYEQGRQAARSAGKPMLLFFTADWCTFCKQMADEAFSHEQVVRLSQQFVCVQVDADAEPGVCGQFEVKGYPTIQFLSPRGVPLNRVTGKQPGHELIVAMQTALQAVARRPDAHLKPTTR